MKKSNNPKPFYFLALLILSLVIIILFKEGIIGGDDNNYFNMFYDTNAINITMKYNYYYVQTINDKYIEEIEQFNNAISNYKNKNVAFIAIEKGNVIKNSIRNNNYSDVYSFSWNTENKYIKEIWAMQGFFLYDKEKRLLRNMNNMLYEKAAKIILNKYVNGDVFSASKIFKIRHNMYEYIDKDAQHEAKYKNFIYILMSEICSGCTSGYILKYMNEYSKSNKETKVICILGKSFSNNDIVPLKTQLKIEYDIITGNKKLELLLNSEIEKYNELTVSNIVIIADKNQNIEYVYDSYCECWNQLEEHLNALRGKSQL